MAHYRATREIRGARITLRGKEGHSMNKPTLTLLLSLVIMLGTLLGSSNSSAQTIVQQFTAVSAGADLTTDMDLISPTLKGSLIITIPELLTPNIKVLSITDNAPDGSNTYKQVTTANSTCPGGSITIWYCQNCNPGATELKFHNNEHTRASLNSFLELSDMALSDVLDGAGVQVSTGVGTSAGLEVGPTLKTTTQDFVIARFSSTAPRPKGATPSSWTFKPAYVYQQNAPAGNYQPTLTGGSSESKFCMSMAAFKTKPTPAK